MKLDGVTEIFPRPARTFQRETRNRNEQIAASFGTTFTREKYRGWFPWMTDNAHRGREIGRQPGRPLDSAAAGQ